MLDEIKENSAAVCAIELLNLFIMVELAKSLADHTDGWSNL